MKYIPETQSRVSGAFRVSVNGVKKQLRTGESFADTPAILAALDAAGISYTDVPTASTTANAVAGRRIKVAGNGNARVQVNGKKSQIPKGEFFFPTTDQRNAILAAGIPFETEYEPRRTGSAMTVLNAGTSNTGVTATSAGTIAVEAYPVAHPSGTTTGLSLACAAADTFVSMRFSSAVIPANFKLSNAPLVGFWVYWSAANGSVALRFTSDNFSTKTKTFSWAWSGQLHLGWNFLLVRPAGDGTLEPAGATWTTAGGFLDTDTVNGIEIQLSTNGASLTKIHIGPIGYHTAPPARGVAVWGFDKFGEASIPNLALPIFEKWGVTGYWAGDANLVESAGNARTYAQKMYDAGWPLITQGRLHPDYTVAGAVQLGADIDSSRTTWAARGWTRGANEFSYPLSANNAATDAMLVSKGVKMARSGWAWIIQQNQYNMGPKLIGHGAVNIGGKTLTQVKALLDRAAAYGGVVFPFAHGIVAGGTGGAPPADPLYWYANDLDAAFAYQDKLRSAGLLDVFDPLTLMSARGV